MVIVINALSHSGVAAPLRLGHLTVDYIDFEGPVATDSPFFLF